MYLYSKVAELLLQGAVMEFEVDEEGSLSPPRLCTKMASKLLEDSGTLQSVIVYGPYQSICL